tara:strand:- start:389 stop:586 length:198 start_codon:yes stop_codon:yes gene_type:complete
MKLTLTLETDNAAFEDGSEVSRILHSLASLGHYDNLQAYNGEGEQKLRDINGNTCGTWSITNEEQ